LQYAPAAVREGSAGLQYVPAAVRGGRTTCSAFLQPCGEGFKVIISIIAFIFSL
jgi:hypothetical protein